MTDNVVVFDPTKFRGLYPQFSSFTGAQLHNFFLQAEMIFNNTDKSFIKDLARREMLLFLIVAHLAQIQTNINAGNSMVGRISSASEGSVSVSVDYGTVGNNENGGYKRHTVRSIGNSLLSIKPQPLLVFIKECLYGDIAHGGKTQERQCNNPKI